jgi:hypothetical protein
MSFLEKTALESLQNWRTMVGINMKGITVFVFFLTPLQSSIMVYIQLVLPISGLNFFAIKREWPWSGFTHVVHNNKL